MDVMLLKQQGFTASGAHNRQEQSFEYAFRRSHPLLQFLPQKLAEWIAHSMADELDLPPKTGRGDDWSSEDLNSILLRCFVSDRQGNNLHTFNCLEFESDLYRGVMRARCYPFDMEDYRFHGKNTKVFHYICITYAILCIYVWHMFVVHLEYV